MREPKGKRVSAPVRAISAQDTPTGTGKVPGRPVWILTLVISNEQSAMSAKNSALA